MSQATTLFTLTQLAEVSYTRFQPGAIGDAEGLRLNIQSASLGGFFSSSQAADFVRNWKLVAYQPNRASGFSASVFERLNPTNQIGTGQYTLALRGTEVGEQDSIDLVGADIAQLVAHATPRVRVKLLCAVPT